MRNRIIFSIGILLLALGTLTACGGGGGNSGSSGNNIGIRGEIDTNGFAIVGSPSFLERVYAFFVGERALAVGEQINQVWGVPIYRYEGEVTANFSQAVKVDIDDSGAFTITLTDSRDWVLLLMDTTQALKKNQIVGYVSVADVSSQQSLVLMPTTDATSTEIDVGTLSQVDDEARSSESLEDQAVDYSLSVDQLLELAGIDDTFKAIKNRYVNYDSANNRFYILRLGFHWQTTLTAVTNTYSDHTGMTPAGSTYKGYTVEVETNIQPASGTCDTNVNTRVPLEIVPPQTVTHSDLGLDYNSATPLSNDSRSQSIGDYNTNTCYDEDFTVQHTTSNGEPYRFGGPWGLDYISGVVPAGEWSIRENSSEIASFDLAAAYPFDGNNNPAIYVPAVRINTDSNNVITSIDVKWYRYDHTSLNYIEVTDSTLFAELTTTHYIGMIDYSGTDGNRAEENHYYSYGTIPSLLSGSEFNNSGWKLGTNTSSTLVLDELSVGYRMGDTSYRFAFRN